MTERVVGGGEDKNLFTVKGVDSSNYLTMWRLQIFAITQNSLHVAA